MIINASNADIALTGQSIPVSQFDYATIDDKNPNCSVTKFNARIKNLGENPTVIKRHFVNPFPIADYTNIDQDYKGICRVPEFEASYDRKTAQESAKNDPEEPFRSLVVKTSNPFNRLLKRCEKRQNMKKEGLHVYQKPGTLNLSVLRPKDQDVLKELNQLNLKEEERREEEEWCEQGMPTNVEDISELPLQFTGDLKTLRKFRLQGPPGKRSISGRGLGSLVFFAR
ncbi:hypothetical protein L596_021094 [Steinernema carpocapsae]|uniref:Uncharacterized protein n=1 Tax=Steinernema carpocapsae TaxID=34508 RepID=A0A4U5MWD7_STECR|nr:hypothetical protein L596_021094 [Steinernema carpocapsae]